MFEVLVIENNQIVNDFNPKPLAMWTCVFDCEADARGYGLSIEEQNLKFDEKNPGMLIWSIMIIDYTAISRSDLALTLEAVTIKEYTA